MHAMVKEKADEFNRRLEVALLAIEQALHAATSSVAKRDLYLAHVAIDALSRTELPEDIVSLVHARSSVGGDLSPRGGADWAALKDILARESA